jgi:hypothetical protein
MGTEEEKPPSAVRCGLNYEHLIDKKGGITYNSG